MKLREFTKELMLLEMLDDTATIDINSSRIQVVIKKTKMEYGKYMQISKKLKDTGWLISDDGFNMLFEIAVDE